MDKKPKHGFQNWLRGLKTPFHHLALLLLVHAAMSVVSWHLCLLLTRAPLEPPSSGIASARLSVSPARCGDGCTGLLCDQG